MASYAVNILRNGIGSSLDVYIRRNMYIYIYIHMCKCGYSLVVYISIHILVNITDPMMH